MTAISASVLTNFWKVRDICQGICSELNNIVDDNSLLDKAEAETIFKDYNYVKEQIDKISSTGYFNKEAYDENNVITLVNNIIDVESKNAKIISKIWQKDISDVNGYDKLNFRFCVKPVFCSDINNIENQIKQVLNQTQSFVTTNLISNANIKLSDPNALLDGSTKSKILPFGLIYDVTKDSFVAATDNSSYVSIKSKSEICDKDFLSSANKGDDYLFINGYATKLKTPKQIIRKFSNNRFTQNDNAVVLDADKTSVKAIFYYSYGLEQTSSLKNILSPIAKELGLPLIAIDVLSFYKQNGKFLTNTGLARICFNDFIDSVVNDLDLFANSKIKESVKKLVGYNTSLRYNFIFKYLLTLQKYVKDNKAESKEDLALFIKKAIVKAVIKHNTLTHEREIANGAPLTFASESTFVPVPADFLR